MLEGLTRPEPRAGYCKVADILDRLEASDRAILVKAVDDETWVAKQLSKSLKERGLLLSDTTILRHRRRECVCA